MSASNERARLLFVLLLLQIFIVGPVAAVPVATQAPQDPTRAVVMGQVVTEAGEPVAAAMVEALVDGHAEAATTTTVEGRYRLSVPPGTVVLKVTSMARVPVREHRVTVAAGDTRQVDVTLRIDPIQFDGFVVTGRSSNRPSVESLPAMSSAVTREEVEPMPAFSLADVAATQPGVDVAENGLLSRTITTRGLGGIFTGAALFMVDYRDAALPSLRADFTHFVPTALHDVERLEVVLGPTTAVYGPNAANGVVHVLTRSPLEAPSTFVSAALGGQSIGQARFRTNVHLGESVGLKVSGEWFQGDEFEYVDPVEAAARSEIENDHEAAAQRLRERGVPEDEIAGRLARIGERDHDLERWRLEGRVDAVVSPGDTLIFQAGTASNTGIELTPLGAAQADDWRYSYVQTRLHSGSLFAQLYMNTSDAGHTWLLRDGAPLIDNSRAIGAQVRHGFLFADDRIEVTYGADWLRTTPKTGGTIHGQYEDEDEVEEYGGYVQGRFGLTSSLDLIATGRLDESNVIEDPVFSPRVGLVYEPEPGRSFRLTLARGFSTPTPTNTFLDISGGRANGPLGALGYFGRAQGTGRDGIRFRQPDGSYLMRSPFTAAADGGPSALAPANARELWLRGVNLLQGQGAVDAQTAAFLRSLDPSGAVGVQVWNPVSGSLDPIESASVPDVRPLEETTTTTLELGYQGLLGDRVLIQTGLWHTWRKNFTSPLLLRTPLLRLNGTELGSFLAGSGMPAEQAAVLAETLGPVPLGVVSSEDIDALGAELVNSYLNHGDLSYWGIDLGFQAELSRRWSLDGSASWVSDDHFEVDGEKVSLNAPEFKTTVGLGLGNLAFPLTAEARLRYHSGFPASSGEFQGTRCLDNDGLTVEDCVDDAALVDLSLGYALPTAEGAVARLKVRNLFDTPYRSFIGSPESGRILSFQIDWTIR